jgi:uncharacterized membrane protein YhaH (DUF805 family)
VAKNTHDHRFARAAGRAARAFREQQQADNERLAQRREQERAADQTRLAERQQARERALDERDELEAGRLHPLLGLARRWWSFAVVVMAGLAAVFLVNGLRARSEGGPVIDLTTGVESVGVLGGATGQFALAGFVGVLTLFTLWGTIALYRRRASAVNTLTTLTALVGIPSLVRGNALLLIVTALLIIGTVLVWLPPVKSRLRKGRVDRAVERAADRATG